MEEIQVVAGSIAGLIFASGSLNMLVKAWQTKDLSSYSLGFIVLNNVGNLVYWLYVISLPFGPIWLMHSFYTLTMLLMLMWYVLYQDRPEISRQRMVKKRRFTPGFQSLRHLMAIFAIYASTNASPSASDIA
jgi:uncharacterized protein with PQ loop repeat